MSGFCLELDSFFIFCISSFVTCSLFIILFSVYGCRKMSPQITINYLKFAYWSILFVWLFPMFGWGYLQIMPFIYPICQNSVYFNIFGVLFGHYPYSIGTILLYIFFLLRLKQIFEGTAFVLSKSVYNLLLIIGTLTQFIPMLIAGCYHWCCWTSNSHQELAMEQIFYIFNAIFMLIVLLLFLHKLYAIMVGTMVSRNNSSANSSENIATDDILYLTVKQTICVLFALITTVFTNLCFGTYRMLIMDSPHHIEFHLMLCLFDVVINILMLHLQFIPFQSIYNKLCFQCHRCCISLFKYIIGPKFNADIDAKHVSHETNMDGQETTNSQHQSIQISSLPSLEVQLSETLMYKNKYKIGKLRFVKSEPVTLN